MEGVTREEGAAVGERRRRWRKKGREVEGDEVKEGVAESERRSKGSRWRGEEPADWKTRRHVAPLRSSPSLIWVYTRVQRLGGALQRVAE